MTPDNARELILGLAPVGGVIPAHPPVDVRRRLLADLWAHLVEVGGYIPRWLRAEFAGIDLSIAKSRVELPQPPPPRPVRWELPLGGADAGRPFAKAKNHKYLKRIPTGKSKPKWRYVYKYSRGEVHRHTEKGKEFAVGMKFADQGGGVGEHGGHFEITAVDDDGKITIRHDETGVVETFDSAWAFRGRLDRAHEHHARQEVEARKARRRAELKIAHGVHRDLWAELQKSPGDGSLVVAVRAQVRRIERLMNQLNVPYGNEWNDRDIEEWEVILGVDEELPDDHKALAEMHRKLRNKIAKGSGSLKLNVDRIDPGMSPETMIDRFRLIRMASKFRSDHDARGFDLQEIERLLDEAGKTFSRRNVEEVIKAKIEDIGWDNAMFTGRIDSWDSSRPDADGFNKYRIIEKACRRNGWVFNNLINFGVSNDTLSGRPINWDNWNGKRAIDDAIRSVMARFSPHEMRPEVLRDEAGKLPHFSKVRDEVVELAIKQHYDLMGKADEEVAEAKSTLRDYLKNTDQVLEYYVELTDRRGKKSSVRADLPFQDWMRMVSARGKVTARKLKKEHKATMRKITKATKSIRASLDKVGGHDGIAKAGVMARHPEVASVEFPKRRVNQGKLYEERQKLREERRDLAHTRTNTHEETRALMERYKDLKEREDTLEARHSTDAPDMDEAIFTLKDGTKIVGLHTLNKHLYEAETGNKPVPYGDDNTPEQNKREQKARTEWWKGFRKWNVKRMDAARKAQLAHIVKSVRGLGVKSAAATKARKAAVRQFTPEELAEVYPPHNYPRGSVKSYDMAEDPGNLGELLSLIHPSVIPEASLSVFSDKALKAKSASGRAHCGHDNAIALSEKSGGNTVWHEFGHAIEHDSTGITAACNAIRNERGKHDDLKHLGSGYKENEKAYEDEWKNAYTGKFYGSNSATEVLAMGVGYLHDDPAGFMAEDFEHFALTIAALSGALGKRDQNRHESKLDRARAANKARKERIEAKRKAILDEVRKKHPRKKEGAA